MNYKMKNHLLSVSFFLFTITVLNGCALLGLGNSASWKEEVLQNDGSKIIIERSQSYGGRHEIGQSSPINEHVISFTLPGSVRVVTWKSEYSQDVGRANFKLLALHVLYDTPYVVTVPNLCLSYNKWGRPNPPYVFFKYDGSVWQRIPLEEFPAELKDINVTIETKGEEEVLVKQGLVPAEMVKKLNRILQQPEYQTIRREPVPVKKTYKSSIVSCPEMISNGKDGWVGFNVSSMNSYEECIKVCKFHKLEKQVCPCDNLRKTKPVYSGDSISNPW
ncbi:MAG: hypothetical protein OEL83_06065 [Desulforhopalus sp.]|nr:hypothetical protein [Desulforhopalus sp.]